MVHVKTCARASYLQIHALLYRSAASHGTGYFVAPCAITTNHTTTLHGSCNTLFVEVQTPRVCQTAIMSAMFFTLFEFWKAQLKPHHHRASKDRLLEPKIWHKRRDHVWKRQFVQN